MPKWVFHIASTDVTETWDAAFFYDRLSPWSILVVFSVVDMWVTWKNLPLGGG